MTGNLYTMLPRGLTILVLAALAWALVWLVGAVAYGFLAWFFVP